MSTIKKVNGYLFGGKVFDTEPEAIAAEKEQIKRKEYQSLEEFILAKYPEYRDDRDLDRIRKVAAHINRFIELRTELEEKHNQLK